MAGKKPTEEKPENQKKRAKLTFKGDESGQEESMYLIEEGSLLNLQSRWVKNNKQVLESLSLLASGSFSLRLVIRSQFYETLVLLKNCLIQQVSGNCVVLNCRVIDCDEILNYARQAVKIHCNITTEIYEGEITEYRTIKDNNGDANEMKVTLRTAKSSKTIRIGKALISAFNEINIGDFIFIDPGAGLIKRLGRGEGHASEFDLECDRYIQLPKCAVNVERCHESITSLYDLDLEYASKLGCITEYVRTSVDLLVKEYFNKNVAKTAYSLLIVESAELLSNAQISELNLLADKYPWLRIVMIVNESKASMCHALNGYLPIEVNVPEDVCDFLAFHHSKLEDEAYLSAVMEYTERYSLETIGSIIEACEDADSFRSMMSSFSIQ